MRSCDPGTCSLRQARHRLYLTQRYGAVRSGSWPQGIVREGRRRCTGDKLCGGKATSQRALEGIFQSLHIRSQPQGTAAIEDMS